jgi:hypothetical protein
VSDELREAVRDFVQIARDLEDFDGDRRGIIHAKLEAENRLAQLIGEGELHDLNG